MMSLLGSNRPKTHTKNRTATYASVVLIKTGSQRAQKHWQWISTRRSLLPPSISTSRRENFTFVTYQITFQPKFIVKFQFVWGYICLNQQLHSHRHTSHKNKCNCWIRDHRVVYLAGRPGCWSCWSWGRRTAAVLGTWSGLKEEAGGADSSSGSRGALSGGVGGGVGNSVLSQNRWAGRAGGNVSSSGGGGKERADSLPSANSDSSGLDNTQVYKGVRRAWQKNALFTLQMQSIGLVLW